MVKITNRLITEFAKELGFQLAGFAKYELLNEETEKLQNWLNNNYQGGMSYMERNLDKKRDVSVILPGAKSIISLGINYFPGNTYSNTEGTGKISRYALGKDYHEVIEKKVKKLIESIKEINPEFEAKAYIDSGPTMDKVWGIKAGLGWQGKHSNLINPEIGSWFFLATIITNQEFEGGKIITDHCGTCTKCIDACPTGAIVNPYVVDSSKCISYLTIENKDNISVEFEGKFNNWIFGCDICQEVCPWNNKFSTTSTEEEFIPFIENEMKLDDIARMEQEEFSQKFKGNPIKRAKLKGLKRNAEFLRKKTA